MSTGGHVGDVLPSLQGSARPSLVGGALDDEGTVHRRVERGLRVREPQGEWAVTLARSAPAEM